MVLPEKLVRVGLGLGSFLPSTAPDVGAASHEVLKLRDLGGLVGSSTTDLVRFSSTLKVARAIVEEHKRADIVEVPTSSLVSILDRIKALEKEVEDLLNGKKVNKDSKGIEPLESGPASGDSVSSSLASSPDGGSSGKGSGGSPGGSSGSSSDGKSSTSSGSSSDGGSDSSSSPSNKYSASGSSNSSGGSTSTPESKPGSTGGLTAEEIDCAPEHLLYRLGGGSVQRRSVTVSEHPLFRRTTNCTLDSVSGGSKGKNLPSGAAVFKEDSSSATVGGASPASGDGSADSNDGTADKSGTTKSDTKSDTTKSDTKSDTASPATDKSAEKSADQSDNNFADKLTNKSGDESDDKSAAPDSQSVLSSASADGSAAKQDGASLTLTSPPSTTTAAANVGSEAEGSAAESEEETTITTTMTSTSYTTVTVYRRPSSTKAGLDGKYANATASISAPASASHLFVNGTANSTATNTPPSPAALLFITGATGSASSPSATEISSASSGNNSSAAAADGVRAESTTTGSGQIFFENNSTASQPEAVALPSLPNSVGDVSTSSLQTVSSLASADSTAAVTGEKVAVSPATVTLMTTSTTTITITPAGSAVKKPEAATSALATDINGALVKRRSGFQTVRTLRRRTADADEHF
ncbi:hypothetical protein MY10362_008953 [Beauveria mimosiformis]